MVSENKEESLDDIVKQVNTVLLLFYKQKKSNISTLNTVHTTTIYVYLK